MGDCFASLSMTSDASAVGYTLITLGQIAALRIGATIRIPDAEAQRLLGLDYIPPPTLPLP